MPRRGSPYGPAYERARARLLAGRPPCWLCRRSGDPADSADHVPPLAEHDHVPHDYTGRGCCVLRPAHLACQVRSKLGGWGLANARRRRRAHGQPASAAIPAPSRVW